MHTLEKLLEIIYDLFICFVLPLFFVLIISIVAMGGCNLRNATEMDKYAQESLQKQKNLNNMGTEEDIFVEFFPGEDQNKVVVTKGHFTMTKVKSKKEETNELRPKD